MPASRQEGFSLPRTEVLEPAAPAERTLQNERTKALLWVLHGAAWLALIAYCWTAWVVSGDFTPNKIGRGEEPDWYVAVVRGWEIAAVVFTIAILWVFVIRPKLRTGRMSFDGLMALSCWLMFFQEPWMNWINLQFLYSTTSINFGSWLPQIPGWSSPNAELIPVPMWAGLAYLFLVFIPGYLGSRFMSYLRNRRPDMGPIALVASAFGVLCVFDLVLESFITRTQLFSYPTVIPELTLFEGTDHQFPIYETISWAGTYTALACLHFFRDDRGLSWPERGIEKLRITSGRLQTMARFCAIVGFCQLTILFTYNIPYQIYGLHAGPVPEVFQDRPWRMAGVCGPGTDYACPDPDLPISRKGASNRISEPAAGE